MVALGFVHRDIGVLDQRVGILAVLGREGDADACLDPQTHPVDGDLFGQRRLDLRGRGDANSAPARGEERELVPAEAGNGRRRSDGSGEPLPDLAEYRVTDAMAETVVDLLE